MGALNRLYTSGLTALLVVLAAPVPVAAQSLRDCLIAPSAPSNLELDGSLQDWPAGLTVPLPGPAPQPECGFLWSPQGLIVGVRLTAPQASPTRWGPLCGGPRLQLFFRSRPPQSILTSAQLWPPSAVVVDLAATGLNAYRIGAPVGERLELLRDPGAYKIEGPALTVEALLPWSVVEVPPQAGALSQCRVELWPGPGERAPTHAWPELPEGSGPGLGCYGDLVLGGPVALVAAAARYYLHPNEPLPVAVRLVAPTSGALSASAHPPDGPPTDLTPEPVPLPPGESVVRLDPAALAPGTYELGLKARCNGEKAAAPTLPLLVLPAREQAPLAAGEAHLEAVEPALAGVRNTVFLRFALPADLATGAVLALTAPAGWSPAQARTAQRYGYVSAAADGPAALEPVMAGEGARFVVRDQPLRRGEMVSFVYGDSPLGGFVGTVATKEGGPGDSFALSQVTGSEVQPLSAPGALALQVLPGAPRALRVLAPRQTRARTPFALELWVVDRFGNVNPQFRGPVTLRSDPPGASVPESVEFRPADRGRRSLEEGVTLPAPGTYVFLAQARGGVLEGRSEPVRCE